MKLAPPHYFEASSISDDSESTAEDVLRFLDAYFSIRDPAKQAEVFALLVLHASKSPKYSEALHRLATQR